MIAVRGLTLAAACVAIVADIALAEVASVAPILPAVGAVEAPHSGAIELTPLPLYGADIRSLTFDPGDPQRAFAGTSAGHVYRSDDGGSSFHNAGAEIPFPGWVVGSLVFDVNRPGRLWAGLWGIWGGGIVAYSDDAASTWKLQRTNAGDNAQVYALATVPGIPDRLIAGTRAGVEISNDGGRTFRAVGRDLPGLIHVSSLYVDRDRPQMVVAGTWRRAYRSIDGGETWQGVFEGMVLDSEVFSLHASAERPGELWASTCGWVYRGDELGNQWSRFTSGLAEKRTPSFAVLPGERLLAGTVAGAFLSTDRGASFRRTTSAALSVLAIAWHPDRPERILLGTEGAGIWSSADGGETFTARPVGMRNLRVPALDEDGHHLFAAVAHAGPASGIYRSPDGGNSFEPLPVELPTVLAMGRSDGRLFVATERGLFERDAAGSAEGSASGELDRARFHRVPELGERRIEQLAVAPGRVVARARDLLFELDASSSSISPRFRQLPLRLPGLRSIALAGGDLWVLRDEGLFRLAGSKLVASSLPFPASSGSELLGVDGELLYSGKSGLERRDAASGAWLSLRAGAVQTLATGSQRYPLVVETGGSLALLDSASGTWLAVDPPYPAAETLSALVSGDRLLLGSSGFGVWQARLPEPAGPDGAQRSTVSEARIRK